MKLRSKHLDIAKALCLILMIAGHTQGLNKTVYHFIYSFHMPAFFIIAGMTWSVSQASWRQQVWSKFKRLIIPAWIFGAINGVPYLVRMLRGKIEAADFLHRFVGTFTGAAQTADTFDCTPLWFLYAIFLVYVMEICASPWLTPGRRLALVVVILCLCGIDPAIYHVLAPVQLKYALTGMLFFQAGMLCKAALDSAPPGHPNLWLVIAFGAWIIPAIYSPTLGLNNGYLGSGATVLLGFYVALAGTFLVIRVARALPEIPLLIRLAQVSLPIVGLNYLVEQRLNHYLGGVSLFVVETVILAGVAVAITKTGKLGLVLHGRM